MSSENKILRRRCAPKRPRNYALPLAENRDELLAIYDDGNDDPKGNAIPFGGTVAQARAEIAARAARCKSSAENANKTKGE